MWVGGLTCARGPVPWYDAHASPAGASMLSLMTILEARGAPLTEVQLWAVCNVAAAQLRRCIHEPDTPAAASLSHGAGQKARGVGDHAPAGTGAEAARMAGRASVLVSPTTMFLGADGSIAFKATWDADEVAQFLPEGGARWPTASMAAQGKIHSFSLAATLYAAADFGLPVDEEPKISEDMELVFSSMTDENIAERLDLEYVVDLTNDALVVCANVAEDDRNAAARHVRALHNSAKEIAASQAISLSGGGALLAKPSNKNAREGVLSSILEGVSLRRLSDTEAVLSACRVTPLTVHERLMQDISTFGTRNQLKDANERIVGPLAPRHAERLAIPPTYVTPRDALLRDITAQRWTLQAAPAPLGAAAHGSSGKPAWGSAGANASRAQGAGAAPLIQLALPESMLALLHGWDPLQQVCLPRSARPACSPVTTSWVRPWCGRGRGVRARCTCPPFSLPQRPRLPCHLGCRCSSALPPRPLWLPVRPPRAPLRSSRRRNWTTCPRPPCSTQGPSQVSCSWTSLEGTRLMPTCEVTKHLGWSCQTEAMQQQRQLRVLPWGTGTVVKLTVVRPAHPKYSRLAWPCQPFRPAPKRWSMQRLKHSLCLVQPKQRRQ